MAGNAGMEHLIPMVNKLQDAFAQTGYYFITFLLICYYNFWLSNS